MEGVIKNIISYLDTQPIIKAWVFGSVARGEETEESDIDLLVKFDPEARIGLFTYSRIINDLEDIAHKKIDLVEDGTLYPWVRESVENEKILIYERPRS